MKHRQSHWRDILELTVDIFSHVDGSQLVGLLNAEKEKSKVKYLFPNAHELRVDNEELVADPLDLRRNASRHSLSEFCLGISVRAPRGPCVRDQEATEAFLFRHERRVAD